MKEHIFNLTPHSTHFIYGYIASDILINMVKEHRYYEGENPQPPLRGLLLPISRGAGRSSEVERSLMVR